MRLFSLMKLSPFKSRGFNSVWQNEKTLRSLTIKVAFRVLRPVLKPLGITLNAWRFPAGEFGASKNKLQHSLCFKNYK